jgi:hypothetical protein
MRIVGSIFEARDDFFTMYSSKPFARRVLLCRITIKRRPLDLNSTVWMAISEERDKASLELRCIESGVTGFTSGYHVGMGGDRRPDQAMIMEVIHEVQSTFERDLFNAHPNGG